MSGVGQLVTSGPLILALPVAAVAGAVTFLSPCCLPLVPAYLSFVTGMAGAGGSPTAAVSAHAPAVVAADGSGVAVAAPPLATTATAPSGSPRGRMVAGTALFVLGFSVVFVAYGAALGGLGHLLTGHARVLTQVLGGLTIVLGLLFAGVLDRFSFAGRRPPLGAAEGRPGGSAAARRDVRARLDSLHRADADRRAGAVRLQRHRRARRRARLRVRPRPGRRSCWCRSASR